MAKCLVDKDYEGFSAYTYPKIVEMMGGKEKMISMLQNTFNDSLMKIISDSLGEPGKLVSTDKELQCIVPQKLVMTVGKQQITMRSCLIAVSDNDGKNWYFIDGGGEDSAALKASLPNLSKSLVIPPKEAPVVTELK